MSKDQTPKNGYSGHSRYCKICEIYLWNDSADKLHVNFAKHEISELHKKLTEEAFLKNSEEVREILARRIRNFEL
jgi:hypothetical protein